MRWVRLTLYGAAVAFQALTGAVTAQPAQPPLAEQPDASIGYATVAAALADLRHSPSAKVTVQDGWTLVEDSASVTTWSFAPVSDPAYPSAVRRQLANEDGAVRLHMTIRCEASKAACDDLVRRFEKLNAQMTESLRRAH